MPCPISLVEEEVRHELQELMHVKVSVSVPDANDAGSSIARPWQISMTEDLAPHARREMERMEITTVRSVVSYE